MAWANVNSGLLGIAALLCADMAFAQAPAPPSNSTSPQANSREELDAFGAIMEAGNPSRTVETAQQFLNAYPNSEFFVYAALAGAHSSCDLGKLSQCAGLARQALQANPNSIDALLLSARLMVAPGIENPPKQRMAAKTFAATALDLLKRKTIPTASEAGTWLRTRNSFEAAGKYVLGSVELLDGNLDSAKVLLDQAVALDPRGEYLLRLAMLCAAKGDSGTQAMAARAIAAGPEWVASFARELLRPEKRVTNDQP